MRGNPRSYRRYPELPRSIPAYAGEPNAKTRSHSSVTVYPRVCGGTGSVADASPLLRGLSPRMRGNPVAKTAPACEGRSIPAYAGEPKMQLAAGKSRTVYPRVCGGTG